ncbi:MAG TPA: LamG-like jellyroll fold domain-containing protein [Bacteroidia bacterium]|jgi:hypothetical protein
MSLGELPPSINYRGYYRLENLNDSSGNGRTLSNSASVVFNTGKFKNAADFGSTGTNKGLFRAANILSADQVATITTSFWFKLNSTANGVGNQGTFGFAFFNIWTGDGATFQNDGCVYFITAGVFKIRHILNLTGGVLNNDCVFSSIPSTSEWVYVTAIKTGSITSKIYVNGVLRGSATGSGTTTSAGIPGVNRFTIGNQRSLSIAAWIKMDEVIVEEREWSASEIRKYYTQAKGRFMMSQ